jgi:hypothetical protein
MVGGQVCFVKGTAISKCPGNGAGGKVALFLMKSGKRSFAVVKTSVSRLSRNVLPPKYVPVPTYYTKFGTFGNERHLPSGEMVSSRDGFAGFVSRSVSVFDVVISSKILRIQKWDTMLKSSSV